ncbi:UNVERIFIED_CONTAM: hypothetical protein K2H54_025919 [Gekko kuhli]
MSLHGSGADDAHCLGRRSFGVDSPMILGMDYQLILDVLEVGMDWTILVLSLAWSILKMGMDWTILVLRQAWSIQKMGMD